MFYFLSVAGKKAEASKQTTSSLVDTRASGHVDQSLLPNFKGGANLRINENSTVEFNSSEYESIDASE